jgi:hypothetical protein
LISATAAALDSDTTHTPPFRDAHPVTESDLHRRSAEATG